MSEQITKCPKCEAPLTNVAEFAMCLPCQEKGEGKLFQKLEPGAARAAVMEALVKNLPVAVLVEEVQLTKAGREKCKAATKGLYRIGKLLGCWARIARKTIDQEKLPKDQVLANDDGKVHQFTLYIDASIAKQPDETSDEDKPADEEGT